MRRSKILESKTSTGHRAERDGLYHDRRGWFAAGVVMNRQLVLKMLRFELEFFRQGGYARSVRQPWQPSTLFRDSPTCLNFSKPYQSHPCDACMLMPFVPEERRDQSIPCHHIPLNAAGDTIAAMVKRRLDPADQKVVEDWLRRQIEQLEADLRSGAA